MKKFLMLLLLFVVLGSGYFLVRFSRNMNFKDTSYDPAYVSGKLQPHIDQISVLPSLLVSPLVADPTSAQSPSMLLSIKHILPQISWGKETPDTLSLLGKTYSGTSMSGSYDSNTAGVSDFGEKNSLLNDGWSVDTSLAAGGANGNGWGYKMDKEGGTELLYFSYTNQSFTPPPGETKCPCTFLVKVFHSDSF